MFAVQSSKLPEFSLSKRCFWLPDSVPQATGRQSRATRRLVVVVVAGCKLVLENHQATLSFLWSCWAGEAAHRLVVVGTVMVWTLWLVGSRFEVQIKLLSTFSTVFKSECIFSSQARRWQKYFSKFYQHTYQIGERNIFRTVWQTRIN